MNHKNNTFYGKKLTQLFKTREYDTGEEVLYIATGDGYFPRFGSYPIQFGDWFKFTDSDRIWIWTGDMLRPAEPNEGDIAYDYDGRRCAKFSGGGWLINAGTIGLGKPILQSAKIEIGEATKSTFPALIGNVIVHIDPVEFVRENRELLDRIVGTYLNNEDEDVDDGLTFEFGNFPEMDRATLDEAFRQMGFKMPSGTRRYTHTVTF